jgi:hypothetical protein
MVLEMSGCVTLQMLQQKGAAEGLYIPQDAGISKGNRYITARRGGDRQPSIVTYSLESKSECASICSQKVIKGLGSHTARELTGDHCRRPTSRVRVDDDPSKNAL